MTAALSELLQISQVWIVTGFAVFLRIGTAFIVLPAFGEAFIPLRVRLGAALALTAIVAPGASPYIETALSQGIATETLFLTEPISGLVIGIGLRLLIHALQIAGSIAAQSTSLSQISGGATPEPQPAIGSVLLLAGLTLAVMSGLHLHVARAFLRSYELLAAGHFPSASDLSIWGVGRVAHAFSLAFSLAAPFMIASLLYNVALGVINKAMPQLMVAFVGAPAITLGGLFLLLVSLPFLLPVWFAAFTLALADPTAVLP